MSFQDSKFPFARAVRCASRAMIIRGGCLLAIEMRRPGEPELFYILPGGGQGHGETMVESLRRECREELGIEPIVGEVAYVREYIGRNHSFAHRHRNFHQVEVVFRCELPDGVEVDPAASGDRHQIGIRWIPLSELPQTNFYPRKLLDYVTDEGVEVDPLYLGDIN